MSQPPAELSAGGPPAEGGGGGHAVALWIQPRSSREAVVGEREGAIAIRLMAPPVEGAANDALLRFVAKRLGVAQGQVSLVRGHTGRRKWIVVEGYDAAALRAALLAGVRGADGPAGPR